MSADAQFQYSIRREARRTLLMSGDHRDAPAEIYRGPVSSLLTKDRQTDPDATSIRFRTPLPLAPLGNVQGRYRTTQALRVIPAVEVFVGDIDERHRVGRYEVREAHFVRLLSGFPCN